jgi:hypothetical protein
MGWDIREVKQENLGRVVGSVVIGFVMGSGKDLVYG